jgi:hypothetical protein
VFIGCALRRIHGSIEIGRQSERFLGRAAVGGTRAGGLGPGQFAQPLGQRLARRRRQGRGFIPLFSLANQASYDRFD